jgi:hypothetical protein
MEKILLLKVTSSLQSGVQIQLQESLTSKENQ